MSPDLTRMDSETRMTLLRLACFAAWSDLNVAPQERNVVLAMAKLLAVGEDEVKQVEAWLKGPPDEVDPNDLPREHRRAFIHTLEEVIVADGVLAPEECETLALIREFMD